MRMSIRQAGCGGAGVPLAYILGLLRIVVSHALPGAILLINLD
jgi:hypothetical protein